MEWLRCNKCYRAMKHSKRIFLLTQCGHFYCSQCMTGVTTKCPECELQNFSTMSISYPPKLETTHNYFASLDEFLEVCLKTEEFQHNQVSIVARGFEEIANKYENMKKSYWQGMEQTKKLTQVYRNLYEEIAQLEKHRDSLLKSREAARGVRSSRSGSHFSAHVQGQHYREQRQPRTSGLPSQQYAEEQRNTVRFKLPATVCNAANYNLRTPQQAYNPNNPLSVGAFRSAVYTSDSGVSSIPDSSTGGTGVFLVPSGQKVPRSAASVKRQTSSLFRLTEPKSGFHS